VIIPPTLTSLDEIPVKSFKDLEGEYGQDVQKMCADHENLIKVILEEEEELIQEHRQHVDNSVDIVKKDMELLHAVDQPASDIEVYVR